MDLPLTDLAEIRALEEELQRPEVRGSPDAVRALLAEEFFEFGSSGNIYASRDAIVDRLAQETPTDNALQLTTYDYAIHPISADAVLLTYRSISKSPAGGTPRLVLRSSIWRLKEGRWQMVFHQGTVAATAS